jgi:predicted CXXCH cytochrome family protein
LIGAARPVRVPGHVLFVDDTSAATGPGETKGADAVSGATGAADADAVSGATAEAHDAATCLKCHGPFEKLAKRTEGYVTEWDEKANPHVHVPHDSTTIVECTECHDPHPIPFQAVKDGRKPTVKYCYSCHHAETLVNCNQCHPK